MINAIIYHSQKGLFVQMPQSSYEKGGQKHYTDQFHPITANAREELNAAVLDAYEQKLEQSDTLDEDFLISFSYTIGLPDNRNLSNVVLCQINIRARFLPG